MSIKCGRKYIQGLIREKYGDDGYGKIRLEYVNKWG